MVSLLTETVSMYTMYRCFFFFSGSAAQRRLWPPRSWGFLITHNDAPKSVGVLLDEWSARRRDLYLTTHTQQKNIYALGGIRTHDRSRRMAVDLRPRPRHHWDRHVQMYTTKLYNHNSVAVSNPILQTRTKVMAHYHVCILWLTPQTSPSTFMSTSSDVAATVTLLI
jgi:hypothetical protein